MTLDNILEEINKAETIAILTHETPDGDAIGSSLAMMLALKQLNKNADVIIPEHPDMFNFLPGANEIKKEGMSEKYDLAIALDCSDINRLNGFASYFENAKETISIDHHSANKMFGDYNFVNPVAPACAQILITIFEYLNIQITAEIGTCLIAGIITDTGGFKYQNVTAETFEFASSLLSIGVNISDTYKKVMETKTMANFNLRKIAMNNMELLEDGKIAFTYITADDYKKTNAKIGDHEGLVELGREIAGVEVSVFLRETEDGVYKISLRSNEYVNVSDIAMMFSGGGHVRAAGCITKLPLEEAKIKIVNQIKNYLR